jgi:hypothetical protein
LLAILFVEGQSWLNWKEFPRTAGPGSHSTTLKRAVRPLGPPSLSLLSHTHTHTHTHTLFTLFPSPCSPSLSSAMSPLSASLALQKGAVVAHRHSRVDCNSSSEAVLRMGIKAASGPAIFRFQCGEGPQQTITLGMTDGSHNCLLCRISSQRLCMLRQYFVSQTQYVYAKSACEDLICTGLEVMRPSSNDHEHGGWVQLTGIPCHMHRPT